MLKVLGLMMALGSLPLLFMNEGRAVSTAKSLEEGAAVVIHVENSPVKVIHEGRLVHFTGMAATASLLRDPIFAVEAKALQLSRKVEMFQWTERTTNTQSRGRTVASDDTINGFDYNKAWLDTAQPYRQFKYQNGHENPEALPFKAGTLAATDMTVGDFQIPQRMISDLNGDFVPWTLDEQSVASAPPAPGPGASKPRLHLGGLYYGKDPAQPQIGDVRVRFAAKGLSEVSVIGRQHGKTVEPYATKAGRPVEMVLVGSLGASEMFDGAIRSNIALTWTLRIGGFLLAFFGAFMMFKLQGIARFIPVLGSVANAGIGLLALGLASTTSLVTIALAWFIYRPGLSLLLLVLGAAIAAFVSVRARREAKQEVR